MAWIPKPCGEVRLIVEEDVVEDMVTGTAQRAVVTEVRSAWSQSLGEQVASRFAGMLSQLNAAVVSGERAGR